MHNDIKINIKILIENNKIDDALYLLMEYKKIVNDDFEVYSIEAIIYILKCEYDNAKNILLDGLNKDFDNFELLFNLAYLYEIIEENKIADIIYNIAESKAKDKEMKKIINDKLSIISINKKYKALLVGKKSECMDLKQYLKNIDVIDMIELNNFLELKENREVLSCDFILFIDDMEKKDINYNNIPIFYFNDFRNIVIEGLDYKILNLITRNKVEGIITGLSYAEVGILDSIKENFFNTALSSQDLYYDFLLMKYIYKFKNVKNNLKYAIINLGYYSLDYDITKSIAKYRVQRYSKYFSDFHCMTERDIIGVYISKVVYEQRSGMNDYINLNKLKSTTVLKTDDLNGVYEAIKNSKMKYPNTRKEYEGVMEDYLDFLIERNIKPIVVVCPTSKHYRNHFDFNKKKEFYKYFNRINSKYDIQILDYFDSELFEDEDFWDYSHLNRRGAEKFTEILYRNIRW